MRVSKLDEYYLILNNHCIEIFKMSIEIFKMADA